MPHPMLVVRGRLLAVPRMHEADRSTGRPAYLGALVGEERPRSRRGEPSDDGMTVVMVRFTGMDARLLAAHGFHAGEQVTVTGIAAEPEALIDGFGRACAMPAMIGETMQPDPIGAAHARDEELERERELYEPLSEAWCDPMRGEYVGDGISRTAGGVAYEPLSGYIDGHGNPLDPADPDFIAAQATLSKGMIL